MPEVGLELRSSPEPEPVLAVAKGPCAVLQRDVAGGHSHDEIERLLGAEVMLAPVDPKHQHHQRPRGPLVRSISGWNLASDSMRAAAFIPNCG